MPELTRQEEIVLTTVWRLGDTAYGVAIRQKIAEITKRKLMYGTLYNTLNQLLRKRFVIKTRGEPTPERGGRSKMYYHITDEGLKALQESKLLYRSLWEGLPDPVIQ
jgi:DNA-binding PadR family transcriptional regulator